MRTDLFSGAKLSTLLLLTLSCTAAGPRIQRRSQDRKAVEDSSGPTCTYYISPSGSDQDAGTLDKPWRTLQKAFDTATAGQNVCLRGGIYPQFVEASAGFNQVEKRSGAPERPI